MGGDEKSGIRFLPDFLQERENFLAGVRIEVAGGLIRDNDTRLVDQRPGNGDALLLATGELIGTMIQARGEADSFEQHASTEANVGTTMASDPPGNRNIFERVELREEMVCLEDKADLLGAKARESVTGDASEVLTANNNFSGIGDVQPAKQVEKSAFPRARGPSEGDKFSSVYLECDTAQDLDIAAAESIALAQVARDKQWITHGATLQPDADAPHSKQEKDRRECR